VKNARLQYQEVLLFPLVHGTATMTAHVFDLLRESI
jgi:hypothetical protein